MATVNPYRAPAAAVADAAEQYQPVNLYSTAGRIGRARYIAYTLGLSILFGIFVAAVAALLGAIGLAAVAGIVTILLYVGLLVWMFMLTIQRAHDFNTTGWLSILMLIPWSTSSSGSSRGPTGRTASATRPRRTRCGC